MTRPMLHDKIQPHHLGRRAVIYLRQSSEKQVRENTESQRLQYGLRDRAVALGWTQVEVIDIDLGRSASLGAAQRDGFDRLVGSVARGEVGIVMNREVSRLIRTDKDWCHLTEVCQVFDTLIGDGERVYDLRLVDDQLVLGIKATMSVAEIQVLRLRLVQGMREKARRGELVRLLPPGYVRDGMGTVVKDPDRRVQQAVELVFRRFRETWSVRQTFTWFHDEGIDVPVNKSHRGRDAPRVATADPCVHRRPAPQPVLRRRLCLRPPPDRNHPRRGAAHPAPTELRARAGGLQRLSARPP